MLKRNKKTVVVTTIITVLPMLVGLLLWNRLPEQIATHFDANGNPDGWSSRFVAVFGLPLILLGAHLLCTFGTLADPKKKNIQDKIFRLILWAVPVISLVTSSAVYLYALNVPVDMALVCSVLVGAVFIVVGNYLPKCRQSYTVGIKLPWTLADEDNWNRTHRLAGGLWMAGGALILLAALIGLDQAWLFLCIAAVMVLVPTVYSFLLYLKKGSN